MPDQPAITPLPQALYQAAKQWHHKDLLSLQALSVQDIFTLLKLAQVFEAAFSNPPALQKSQRTELQLLEQAACVTMFFEASTRTRVSFSLAAQHLGAHVVDIAESGSAIQKGESLLDSIRNLEALKVNLLVLRHPESGIAAKLAPQTTISIVNAGDGKNEHPSQALLDIFTLYKHFGDLKNKRIAFVGDCKHSRVAHSGLIGLQKLGAHVALIAPPELVPEEAEDSGVEVYHELDPALPQFDAFNLLRIQFERHKTGDTLNRESYRRLYGMTDERLQKLSPQAVILAPGPIHRGVEIDSEVADGSRSLIFEQPRNGLFLRMALLALLYRRNSIDNEPR